MTTYRCKFAILVSLAACSCSEQRSEDDIARIEELEVEIDSLQSKESKKTHQNNIFGSSEPIGEADDYFKQMDEQRSLDQAAIEQSRAEAEKIRLEHKVRQLERDKLNLEIQESFSK